MKLIINESGTRLDKVLADHTKLSRVQANEEIKKGTITVNEKKVKPKYMVKIGDVVNYEIPEEIILDYVAEDIPIEIVYEDDDVAVVNKPQGMVVHPSHGHPSKTLVNALLFHIKDLSSINGVVRPGIVHRIDKDTSGLLMIAKNNQAHQILAQELKNKKAYRHYLAIVHGNLPNDRGIIEAPIARSDKNRKKQAVKTGGKPALTRFEVLERYGDYTLVSLTLETGRTHQIRVHMAYIGHPIAGDPLYGPKKTLKGQGQFLHAKTIGFTHPKTKEMMTFSIQPPEIFLKTLQELRELNS
ncbi:RluA family pseudouridine synthase [Streptococcus marimammalium]|uniref:RluA family pseudouridine synthase n=1 Tax=Streptococcus marimammalium TaxID=269666 RepID=UPI0003719E64|nr:RluA family pseudouridine synthase [Streptococcus marimammalium]